MRRDFQAPAQGSEDPNPVLSSAAVAPGTGSGETKADAAMPDATADSAPTPNPSRPPPTYIRPSAKMKAQQKAVARTAPLSEPYMDATAPAFTPLSPVSEVPIASVPARKSVPSQSYMPQELAEAKEDKARRRRYISASAYAIPLRLPDFVVPGIIYPHLEDSMATASVAPPSFDQRKHSAYHFGALSKILVKLMTKDMFGPMARSGKHLLERTMFASSPYFNQAREEMMNDRPTARNIGGKDVMCIRYPSYSVRF